MSKTIKVLSTNVPMDVYEQVKTKAPPLNVSQYLKNLIYKDLGISPVVVDEYPHKDATYQS